MDCQLTEVLAIDGEQYFVQGNSGYIPRPYLDISFQGDTISAGSGEEVLNTAKVRVTVERTYKNVHLYWLAVNFMRKMQT